MNKTFRYFLGVAVVLAFVVVSACSDDKNDGVGEINVHLTDAPGDYDEVNIEIVGIEAHVSGSEEDQGWITFEGINAGVYNLLDLTGGIDTTLAQIKLPVGKLSQIRLILGENNTVVVDGVTHDLVTPSAQTSGLKLQIHADITEDTPFNLWLDFDAAASIKNNGGSYKLQPSIKVLYVAPEVVDTTDNEATN